MGYFKDWERLNTLNKQLWEIGDAMTKVPRDSKQWQELNEQYLTIEIETELLRGEP